MLFGLGPAELAVIGVIGVLLFGRKLPEVGRYLGQSITSFKSGMRGLENGFEDANAGYTGAANAAGPAGPLPGQSEALRPPQRVATTAPKFEDAPNTGIRANPPQV